MKNSHSRKVLKKIEKSISTLIKEYNKLATKENLDSRIGLVEATAYFETEATEAEIEDGIQVRPKNINKYFAENGPYEAPVSYNIKDIGAVGWMPSSICIRY